MTPPLDGRTLGGYRVIEPLGRGGMGTVHRALHVETGEQVALKTVGAGSPHVVRAIRQEVRALMRLRHPGIARIVADGLSDGLPWYAMELVEGRTLGHASRRGDATRSLVDGDTTRGTSYWTRTLVGGKGGSHPVEEVAGGSLSFDRVLTIVRALCDGLAHLHGEGLVHGDLKPDNIMLRADDYPVIVDFGLASELRGQTSREALDARAELAGTAAYMAPELIRGAAVDARADLYALGCILYELATGRRPFTAYTVAALLAAHLDSRPQPPSQVDPELPEAFDELVLSLMAKEPRDRVGHASDVARLLDQMGATPPSVTGPPARDYLYRSSFVGRGAQMERLRRAFRGARSGAGGLFLVEGESGIGKTRLANQLAAEAAKDGASVLIGQCTSDVARPLEALRGPLLTLGDRCRALGPGATEHTFGGRAKILAPYEPSLAQLPGVAEQPDPAPLPAAASRLRVFQSVVEVLAGVAQEAPVVLVIDDLHWADRLTTDLLLYLGRELLDDRPVMIVATYRSEEARREVGQLRSLARAETVELGRLGTSEVAVMVADMLAHESADALASYVAQQSEGNPFFVAEYLRAALEAGLLRREGSGRWRLSEGGKASAVDLALPLPSSLRALVERRLADLSTEETALVRAAAVAGRESAIDLLVATSGLSEDAALDAVGEVVRRQILDGSRAGFVRFTHDKLREVPYQSMDAASRRALHRRTAVALARNAGDDPPLDDLAHHWLEAGVSDRAVDALHRAGERALSQSAYRRAADCYRVALREAVPDDPRRATWQHGLAEALLGQGDVEHGRERLLDSLQLRGLPTADGSLRLAADVLRQIALQTAHQALPARWIERPGRRQDLLGITRTYQRLVETQWFRSDVPKMVHAGLHALNYAERAGPSAELVRAYATMCLSAGSIPIHPLAERYAALALRTAEGIGDSSAEAYALFITSVYRVGASEWARVESDLERAAEICQRIGDVRFRGESLTVLGMAALYQGDFGRADQLFESVSEAGRRFDNLQHRVWGAIGRAESQMRLGHIDAVDVHLADAVEMLRGPAAQEAEIFRVHGLWASSHLARGDLERAAEHARRAEEHAGALRVPTAHYLLEGYAGLAQLQLTEYERAVKAGRRQGAERARARRAVRAMRLFATIFRIGKPRAATLRGLLSWIEGDEHGARASFRRASDIARALGMRHEVIVAEEVAARCATGGDPFRVQSPR